MVHTSKAIDLYFIPAQWVTFTGTCGLSAACLLRRIQHGNIRLQSVDTPSHHSALLLESGIIANDLYLSAQNC